MSKILKYLLLIISFVVLSFVLSMYSPQVNAEDRIDIVCCTRHFERDKNYNEKNLGIIYNHNIYNNISIGVGGYKNSEYNMSYLVGVENTWKINNYLKFRLAGGIVTGYERGTTPFILPTLSIVDRVNLTLIPTKDGGVSLSFTAMRW